MQPCPTLCDPMDYTVHGILQVRMEWVAFSFFRGSSQPKGWTQVSCIAGRFFTSWATREARIRERTGNQFWTPNQECCHRCFIVFQIFLHSWSHFMTQQDYHANIPETQAWNKRYGQHLLCENFWLECNLKILWRRKFNERVLKIMQSAYKVSIQNLKE